MSFRDFIRDTNNKYQKYEYDPTANAVYNFLSQQRSIYVMLLSNDVADTSALQPLARTIEDMCDGTSFALDVTVDTDADNRKRCVGSMVRHVIQPYGYLPTHKRKVSGARNFVTAMHYSRIAPITRQLNISINTVDAISGDIIASQTITPEDLDQLR